MAIPLAGKYNLSTFDSRAFTPGFSPVNQTIFDVNKTQAPVSVPSGFSPGQNSKIQGLPAFMEQIKGLGEFPQAIAISQYMGQQPSIAEQVIPLGKFMEEQDARRAKTASDLAQRKFVQEIAGAGIGALGRGVTAAVAGGDSAILGAIAQAPVLGTELFQKGLQAQFTPAQPMSPQQYQPRRYFA
jgi:hypothetical protein